MSAIAMAESLLKSGNVAGAMSILKESADPGLERDLLLARCAMRLGDAAVAMKALSAVLAVNPAHVEAAASLGTLYVKQGWLDKAEAHYSKFLKKTEDDRMRVDLALIMWKRNQHTRALQELGRVIARNPTHYTALLQRAFLLLMQGRQEESAADLRILIREAPERNEAWGVLGTAEFGCGNFDAAAYCLREACRRNPADTRFLHSLVLSLTMCGHIEEARSATARLRELDPVRWQEMHDSTSKSRLPGSCDEIDPRPVFLISAHQEQQECNWAHRQAFEDVFRDLIANPGISDPTRLSHTSGIVPLTLAERLRLAHLAAEAAAAGSRPFAHVPAPSPERLRIGYILPHLGEHVVAKILRGFLAAHDPAAVDTHVIAVRQLESDLKSGMVERYAAIPGVKCLDFSPLEDEAAAARIHDLRLDVLVDLGVYNDGARPGILARRPAPVQVSFLGAPFTSGADWMDYIITDAQVSLEELGWCTEAEARMPGSYFTYGHDDAEPPAVPPRTYFGLPEAAFLYSALNSPYKIDPADFACWMRILAATPGSFLLFKDEKKVAANLRAEAARLGMDPARLLFLPRVSDQDYLLRQGAPDLFLDARQYGAHTTMAESLWMGVPALSCRGDAFQNRVGASLLASCGLDELIMPDLATYEATAIALFHDRDRLLRLKTHLLQSRLQAAPFDMPGQARHMEAAFRHMRDRFAAGLSPASFNIGELSGQP
ncbi:MAG: repeat-containing protein [Moraxellaceae bacterium]|jgi:predicted O-linked N-acetylglucosamine transferase (SPINDLY family)|nr:repeat-containing protein [Moraxellaceae bacterium]